MYTNFVDVNIDSGEEAKSKMGGENGSSYAETKEWFDENTFVCRHCDLQSNSRSSMEKHVVEKHGQFVAPEHVAANFDIVTTVYHECQFCAEEVLCERTTLEAHFRTHAMTLQDYEKMYEYGARDSGGDHENGDSSKDTAGHDDITFGDDYANYEDNENDPSAGKKEKKKTKKSSIPKCCDDQLCIEGSSCGTLFTSDYIMSTYRCEMCTEQGNYLHVYQHQRKTHDQVGKKLISFVKKVFHRCNLCNHAMLATEDTVRKHLLAVHPPFLLADYREKVTGSRLTPQKKMGEAKKKMGISVGGQKRKLSYGEEAGDEPTSDVAVLPPPTAPVTNNQGRPKKEVWKFTDSNEGTKDDITTIDNSKKSEGGYEGDDDQDWAPGGGQGAQIKKKRKYGLYQCNICQIRKTSSAKIAQHIVEHHNEQPEDNMTKISHRRNKPNNRTEEDDDTLDEPAPSTSDSGVIAHSMEEQQEEEEVVDDEVEIVGEQQYDKVKVYTNDINEMCRVRCKDCGEECKMDKISTHFRDVHNKNAKCNYEIVRKTYHRCKYCNKSMVFNRNTVVSHLGRCRNCPPSVVSFKSYKNVLASLASSEADASEAQQYTAAPSTSKPKIPEKRKYKRKEQPEMIKEEFNGSNRSWLDVGDGDKFITDDPANYCLCECKICGKQTDLDKIKKHISRKHELPEDNTNYIFIRKSYTRCHDCQALMLFSERNVDLHDKNCPGVPPESDSSDASRAKKRRKGAATNYASTTSEDDDVCEPGTGRSGGLGRIPPNRINKRQHVSSVKRPESKMGRTYTDRVATRTGSIPLHHAYQLVHGNPDPALLPNPTVVTIKSDEASSEPTTENNNPDSVMTEDVKTSSENKPLTDGESGTEMFDMTCENVEDDNSAMMMEVTNNGTDNQSNEVNDNKEDAESVVGATTDSSQQQNGSTEQQPDADTNSSNDVEMAEPKEEAANDVDIKPPVEGSIHEETTDNDEKPVLSGVDKQHQQIERPPLDMEKLGTQPFSLPAPLEAHITKDINELVAVRTKTYVKKDVPQVVAACGSSANFTCPFVETCSFTITLEELKAGVGSRHCIKEHKAPVTALRRKGLKWNRV